MEHEQETGHQPRENVNSTYAAEQNLPPLDPFNNSLIMPLAEFIEHPMARDVVHNGAAFQVPSAPTRIVQQ